MISPFSGPYVGPYVSPYGLNSQVQAQQQQQAMPPPPEASLPRAINYYADYSGCGFWRLIWPGHLLCAHQKAIVHGSTVMCFDPRWYSGTTAIRVQRQATSNQRKFYEFLKDLSQKMNFRLIFEIDDIMFHEDIPEYNKFKPAFKNSEIRDNAMAMMQMSDEITVTCDFMKEYYIEKTGNKNVTVIPNYPPKWWIGNFYNEKKISTNYDIHKKKPRILYAGSGAHFDVENRVNQNDDFRHVLEAIVKTKDKFQWVFLGAFPLALRPYVMSGEFEYHQWSQLYHYPQKIYDLNCNMMVAPLQDNNFNKAKSDLKYIEACSFGLPIACQDLCTYKDAPFKFKTGDEMIDQVEAVLSSKSKYMTHCQHARRYAESRWLENEDNINKYVELYTKSYGHPDRVLLNAINGL
jgi:hypothetical protein